MVKIVSSLFFILVVLGVSAQTNTYSPYSYYGLGEMAPKGAIYSQTMGGISQGLNGYTFANTANPASYVANQWVNFEFNAFGKLQTLHDTAGHYDYKTFNFSRLSLSFPLGKKKNAGMSFGLAPYSSANYKIGRAYAAPIQFSDTFSGVGGINQVYLGAAYKLNSTFSVGANAHYLFGDLKTRRATVFPNDTFTNYFYQSESIVRGLTFDIGIQATHHIPRKQHVKIHLKDSAHSYRTELRNDTLRFTWGITMSPGATLNVTRDVFAATFKEFYKYNTYGIVPKDTVQYAVGESGKIKMPGSLSIGFALSHQWKVTAHSSNFMVGADFETANWTSYRNFGKADSLQRTNTIRIGGYYLPMKSDRTDYFNFIEYRAGVYFSQTPIVIRGNTIQEYGATFGMGLPLKGKRNFSKVNIGLEAGRRGTLKDNLSTDTYIKLSVGMNLISDQWFQRYKYD